MRFVGLNLRSLTNIQNVLKRQRVQPEAIPERLQKRGVTQPVHFHPQHGAARSWVRYFVHRTGLELLKLAVIVAGVAQLCGCGGDGFLRALSLKLRLRFWQGIFCPKHERGELNYIRCAPMCVRPDIARLRVNSSAYSKPAPAGIPCAKRVTRTGIDCRASAM